MAANRAYAVDEISGPGSNNTELPRASTDTHELPRDSTDTYETLQSGDRPDEHTYDFVGGPARKKGSSASAKGCTGTSESICSGRIIAVIALCVILSALTSTLVVFVYHMTFADTQTGGNAGQIQELRSQVDSLVGKQTNSSQQLDTLQEDSSRQLGILELNLANTSQQLHTWRQIQTNISIYLQTLAEGQTTTNRRLDMLAEQQRKSEKQVAFSVYVIQPTSDPTTFYRTTINTGHFNITSGKFTCPIAGLYYFSFSFEHNDKESGNAYCYFHVNGSGSVYVRAQSSPYEVASGSVIRHLSVNDVVNLYCTGLLYVSSGDNTVFSGFLINPDP